MPLPDTLVRNASKDQVNAALQAALMEKDKFPYFFSPVVVNTGSKLVAIDTGIGQARSSKPRARLASTTPTSRRPASMPRTVDVVAISHFHGDHINGLVTADSKPAFPNAEIMVPAPEWAFWMDDGNMSRASGCAEARLPERASRVRSVAGQGYAA